MGWLPNWVTGYDPENAARASAADAKRAELDRQRFEAGKIDAEELARRQTTYGPFLPTDAVAADEAAIDAEFGTGLEESAASMAEGAKQAVEATTGAVRETIGFTFKTVFSLLPWWLWLAAAGALFLYLGGDKIIRRRLAG